MYSIKVKQLEQLDIINDVLTAVGRHSRFTFETEKIEGKRIHRLVLRNIRLKERKPYCGNHAGPCQVNPLFHKPHRKGKWLEGADWVAFNDMVNDVLDLLEITADVQSSTCVIRKGMNRCMQYLGGTGGDFHRYGIYSNFTREKIKAQYPTGTPGIDTYLP